MDDLNMTSAWDLLLLERQTVANIVTMCRNIDEILGGGVPLGRLTEFVGSAGIGKTQLCLQLVVAAQIPPAFGGIGAEAVYIDTEGSFMTQRLSAAAKHFESLAEDEDEKAALLEFTVDNIFAHTYVFRCLDHIQLTSVSHQLQVLLKDKAKVKLVVVDSIAFHFRQEFESAAIRSSALNTIVLNLMKVAFEHKAAVVLTNQMTTKFSEGKSEGQLAPALGNAWGHHCANRILLFWEDSLRKARLFKSSYRPPATVLYTITEDGIRDVA